MAKKAKADWPNLAKELARHCRSYFAARCELDVADSEGFMRSDEDVEQMEDSRNEAIGVIQEIEKLTREESK